MATSHFTAKLGNETVGFEDLGEFDLLKVTLTDAFVLERSTGLSVNEMLAGLERWRAEGTRAMVWFLRYKQGKTPNDLGGIDFVLSELVMVPVPDPTVAKGSPRKVATAKRGTAI